MLPPPPEDWLKGNKNFRMHYIQVHYCNWVENWKSLKRFLRVRSCDWSCRNWDIGTRSDRPPTLGEAQRKCLIWSADHVWKIAARFFFLFFLFALGVWMNRGFHWVFLFNPLLPSRGGVPSKHICWQSSAAFVFFQSNCHERDVFSGVRKYIRDLE